MNDEMIENFKQIKLGEGRFDSHNERMAYIDGFLAAEKFFATEEYLGIRILDEADFVAMATSYPEEFLDYYERFGAGVKLKNKALKQVLSKYHYKKFKIIKEAYEEAICHLAESNLFEKAPTGSQSKGKDIVHFAKSAEGLSKKMLGEETSESMEAYTKFLDK